MIQRDNKLEESTARTESAVRPNRIFNMTELKPADVAFLGEYESIISPRSFSEKPLFVQVLCWSRTSQGWAALTKSWDSMRAYRDDTTSVVRVVKGPEPPPSWVYTVVPKLGAPFRDNPAEESTLAAWISRAQISFTIAVIDKEPKDSEGLLYRASVLDCLNGYQAFLKSPGYEPCRLIVTGEHPQKRHMRLMEAFKEARARLDNVASLETQLLRPCGIGETPLPLELANLASVAIVRYLNAPTASNPIYDAVRAKIEQVPRRITMIEGAKRR